MESLLKYSFALVPIIDFVTSKVSSPGTIALTTGIPILGFVKSTIIALFNPAFFKLYRIRLMSSKISSFICVLISENLMIFLLLFFCLVNDDDDDAGMNCHFLLYISSFSLYCIFFKSSLAPCILAALVCEASVIARIKAILASGCVPKPL